MNFDPNNLCLESPEFGSVPLVLHSSGHLLLSLVNSSNTLDQYTVMVDCQNSPSRVVDSFQKRDEQTVGSLQPRNQVADRRAEPDEERAADSSMVSGRSDPLDDFIVPLDHPNEEITEQWQDGLHEWYICRDEAVVIQVHARIPRDVSQRRSSHNFCQCLKRRDDSCSTISEISTPRERDAHSASRDPGVVLPQKPSVVALFQRCFRVPHVFGLPPPRQVDSTDRTYFPGISRVGTNGSGAVGKIATTARMMCLYVLMVGATSCLDRVVHTLPVADALPTSCPCVDIFHLDVRDSVEQRVRRKMSEESCGSGTSAWWRSAESEGSAHSCQTPWMQDTPRATEQTCHCVRPNEVASKPPL